MSEKKELNKEELSKVTGGSSEPNYIEINYNIQCSACDYCGPMTYEEGTETGSGNFVDAICPKCHALNRIGLGAA